jgi:type I restriction enzyme M protein
MLDSETKRRIDACRDILVGKVPDPKSQVEQITIALIYKFMDDMDAEAEELGGKRSFFAGDYARFGWAKLMSPSLGGFEVLALYSEAIQKMNENPGVPTLFRDIFKNAYLPYRDPETLKSFLKEINYFTYDHSERLGDAFEYLLSVLGSQGDAGQFRTPRHIIDFMVEVMDPKKNETILDPACGTAGFLISAWKHILKSNTSKKGESSSRAGDLLTPDERARLAASIHGYDISPDMVRLSLVNLYLHGFTDPRIEEYDTLTSDEKWNEVADVILANPPFMSPKGGIKPHKRFTVAATRSEVLFVDYMAEHLTATGRAAIVVPEGIIFQSGTAYKALRKLLVDTSLVAVVSLPAGVFNPYSGVKTSILILGKRLHKQLNSVLFVKVGNDGFNLGAQRRAVVNSDLPQATRLLKVWMTAPEKFKGDGVMAQAVTRVKLGESGDFNLSGERYGIASQDESEHTQVLLGDESIFKIESGGTPSSTEVTYWNGDIAWATLADLPAIDHITHVTSTVRTITDQGLKNSSAKMLPVNTILVSSRATIGRIALAKIPLATNQGFKNIIIQDAQKALPQFVAYMMKRLTPEMERMASGGTFKEISKSAIATLSIPLPPLEVQNQIVAVIEGYQKIIDGARQVLANYKSHIVVHSDWPIEKLGEICENLDSKREPVTKGDRAKGIYPYYGASGIVDYVEGYLFDEPLLLISEDGANLLARSTPIAFSVSGKIWVNNHAHVVCFADLATQKYVEVFINSIDVSGYVTGSAQPKLNQAALSSIKIPLPDLPTQRAIVAEIEAEQALVNANRELIRRMEAKVKAAIDRVWGDSA